MTAVIGSAFVAAASFACIVRANPLGGYVPLPSKKDPCDKFADRTFRITTSSQNGVFGAVSQTFQAEIERNFDTKKTLAGPENSSCSIKKVGSGCKWGRQEESKLGDYKVDHPGYSPYVAVDTDVKISGDGCDDQTLKCSAEHSVLPVSPVVTVKGAGYIKDNPADSFASPTSFLKAISYTSLPRSALSTGQRVVLT